MKGSIIAIALLLTPVCFFAQTNREKALEKGNAAVQLEDEGKYNEALKLLEEAEKLDPEKYDYPYEIGYSYYAMADYKKALKQFKKVIGYKDINDRCFQMLGNTYDALGESEKALESYDQGLKMFPASGRLFLEKGNVFWAKKEYNKALPFYEQGIEADPAFASNYYRAAKLYCSSTEEVWGMIYGELFMNLERNSKRTAEISALLYNTYKSEIKFASDNNFSVSFSKNATIQIDKNTDPSAIKLPFGIGAYEPTLMLSIIGETAIDLNSLDRIRKQFIEQYYKTGNDKKYPNILFEYQHKLLESGHLEAYNHWILMKGDEAAFDAWQASHKEAWESFVKWFNENQLELDNTHKFYSSQY